MGENGVGDENRALSKFNLLRPAAKAKAAGSLSSGAVPGLKNGGESGKGIIHDFSVDPIQYTTIQYTTIGSSERKLEILASHRAISRYRTAACFPPLKNTAEQSTGAAHDSRA